jgi:transposase InsO family protein
MMISLDAWSRRVVGWAIDSTQRADLATNALGMAIDSRGPAAGAIMRGDHGTQFTSWTYTERACRAGLLPSLGNRRRPRPQGIRVRPTHNLPWRGLKCPSLPVWLARERAVRRDPANRPPTDDQKGLTAFRRSGL